MARRASLRCRFLVLLSLIACGVGVKPITDSGMTTDGPLCTIDVNSNADVTLSGYAPCDGCRVVYWSNSAMIVEGNGRDGAAWKKRQLVTLEMAAGTDLERKHYVYQYNCVSGLVCKPPQPTALPVAAAAAPSEIPAVGTWSPCLQEPPCLFSDAIEGVPSWSETEGWQAAQIGGNLHLALAGAQDWNTSSPGTSRFRALQMGLGGGMLPRWFQASMPNALLDVVEIDRSIVAAAPCNGIAPTENLKYHTADARLYLKRDAKPESFHAVFSDMHLLPCLRTQEFFESVHRALRPGGVLTINFVGGASVPQVARTLGKVFGGEVEIGQSKGWSNQILRVRKDGGSPVPRSLSSPGSPAVSPGGEMIRIWNHEADFRSVDIEDGPLERDAQFPECSGHKRFNRINRLDT